MPRGVYKRTSETCAAISKVQKGIPKSPEHCANISKAQQGVPKSPFTSEHRASLSRALTGRILSHETRIAMSASRQGISVENWIGFVSFGEYCPKFNEKLKRQIRDQYNNCDYMSGLPVTICNNDRNLDVHHIDYNKQQGCNDHEWRLIPLSRSNHVKTNVNRSFWNRLFTYSLQYDETYYEDELINIWEMK